MTSKWRRKIRSLMLRPWKWSDKSPEATGVCFILICEREHIHSGYNSISMISFNFAIQSRGRLRFPGTDLHKFPTIPSESIDDHATKKFIFSITDNTA